MKISFLAIKIKNKITISEVIIKRARIYLRTILDTYS